MISHYLSRKKFRHISANIVLIICVILILTPIIWMISSSLKSDIEIFNMPPTLIPKDISLKSYEDLSNESSNYWLYFKNSVIVSVSTTLLCVALAVFAGYGLSRYTFKGKGSMMLYFLVTQIFPFSLLIITQYLFFSKLHLINSRIAVIFAYISVTLAFSIWMIKNYFDTIPIEIEEAASIDGSSVLGTLFKIVLPITGPGIIAIVIFIFLTSWNEFMIAYTLMQDNAGRTLPPGLSAAYMSFMKISWNGLMAASVVSSIPTIILVMLLQRFIVKGLTAGAVKG